MSGHIERYPSRKPPRDPFMLRKLYPPMPRLSYGVDYLDRIIVRKKRRKKKKKT